MNKAAVVAALGLCLVATMCQNAEQAKQERQERLQRQLKATEHLYRNWRPSAPTYEELRDDVIGEQDRTGHSSLNVFDATYDELHSEKLWLQEKSDDHSLDPGWDPSAW